MRNIDKIKQMTVDEMAEWLEMTDCELCPIRRKCKCKNCQKEFRQYLLQEVEE